MIAVLKDEKPMITPGKKPLAVPTQALADAIAAEWKGQAKFSPQKMPLTQLAYTAIDRIAGQEAQIVEVLLAYVDTDTLSYRASGSDKLLALQKAQWDPVLAWAGREFSVIWQTTNGVMPIDQPQALHEAIRNYFSSLNAMQLSAACILASSYSSLVLALAVTKNHLNAATAFALSRLEEEAQAQQWGRDQEVEQRAARVKEDIMAAGQFLRLLDAA